MLLYNIFVYNIGVIILLFQFLFVLGFVLYLNYLTLRYFFVAFTIPYKKIKLISGNEGKQENKYFKEIKSRSFMLLFMPILSYILASVILVVVGIFEQDFSFYTSSDFLSTAFERGLIVAIFTACSLYLIGSNITSFGKIIENFNEKHDFRNLKGFYFLLFASIILTLLFSFSFYQYLFVSLQPMLVK